MPPKSLALTAIILTLTLIGLASTPVAADVPPRTPEHLKQDASHVVVGQIQKVFTHQETVKQHGGTETRTTYVSMLKVESVEKGPGVAKGDVVFVMTWRHKWNGPGPLPPGNSGHWHTPHQGQRVRVYYHKHDGRNHVLLQSGMAGLPKKTG